MIEQHISNTSNNDIPDNKMNNHKNNFNQKLCYHISKKYTLPNLLYSSKSVKDIFNYQHISHPSEINAKGNDIRHTYTTKLLIPNRTQTLQSQSNATLHLSSKRSLSPRLKAKQSSRVTNNVESFSPNCLSNEMDNNEINNNNTIHNEVAQKPQRRRAINIKQLSSLTPKNSDKKLNFMKGITRSLTKENFVITKQCCSVKCKRFIKEMIESDIEAGIMAGLFLIGLFLSDIKTIFLDIKYDILFDTIYFCLAVLLLMEITCSLIVVTHYLNSFFFWLDIFSVLSLLTEIEKIKKGITYLFLTDAERSKSIHPQTERIWTILRLLKVIKMFRIVKVYKAVITFTKNYEIRKKLEEIRNKELEKIKNKEKKSIAISIKKKRTTANPIQINNFVSSINANNSNMNLIATSNLLDNNNNNKHFHHRSAATLNSVLSVNTRQLDNISINTNVNITNMNANPTNMIPFTTNSAAEAALKKMIENRQKERKKSLQKESKTKITKVLFLNITQKLLLIILFFFFIPPLLDEDFYSTDTNSNYKLLSNIFEFYIAQFPEYLHVNLQNNTIMKSHANFPIISILYLNNRTLFANHSLSTDLNNYRYWEYHKTYSFENKITIIYSTKRISIITSYNNIVKTTITLVVMFYLSVLINSDLDSFVLKPLEMMFEIVQAVAKDPVNYKSIEDMNKNMLKNSVQSKKGNKQNIDTETLSVDYEIRTLQFAILRISALIAIGFGEAGGEILKENINSEQGLNPMIPGKKIQSVFGFCFIKNFTAINEVLQEKTILFVNTIADIVHSSVDKFQGVCNKNIGDCFLLVWKFKGANNNATHTGGNNNPDLPTKTKQSKEDIQIVLKETMRHLKAKNENDPLVKSINDPNLQLIADSALVSFLCIIKKLKKSQSVLTLNKDPLLQKRFGHNFKIQMGFGLHIGWGIEGAIGSFYKIDCSYLSPNVNIAARLETATNIYGVDILLSGNLHSCFSEYTQKLCRQIDTVALKGCLFPVKLYTVDLNYNLQPGKLKGKALSGKEKRKMINIKRTKIKNLYEKAKMEGDTKSITEIYYKMSKGFRMLLKDVKSGEFKRYFKLGFDEYIRGNWELAYKYLKQANYIEPTDCPTVKLCNYIFSYGKKAPKDWKGFRKLDSKF